jgi:Ca2+-binding RTX toxin-like protein
MNKEQLKEFVTSPEHWFDVAFDSGAGEDVTLQRFNVEYLRITDTGYNNPDEAFDYTKFPPAYNTVTLSKLTLLSQGEINRLLNDLGSDVQLNEPNIMLGFASTLDGDNQWLNGLVLAQDRQVYEQIFMRQAGEKLFVTGSATLLTGLDVNSSAHYSIFLPIIFKVPLVNPCFDREATIIGTDSDETLIGTPGDDVIVGKGGNDIIFGGEGNDFICGGPGDDTLQGNQGRDFVQGNMGNDIVRGGQDNDVLHGGMDNDEIYGGMGDDKIYGGQGDDKIDGLEGYNLIFAGDGVDTCTPNIGNFECEN